MVAVTAMQPDLGLFHVSEAFLIRFDAVTLHWV
jgi:hypothetical protein